MDACFGGSTISRRMIKTSREVHDVGVEPQARRSRNVPDVALKVAP
jgi:hypothetical protein